MLSVLHISTADNLGGSGRSAYRIHCGLRELGHRSRMLVRTRVTNDPDVGFPHGGRPIVRGLDLLGRYVVDRLDLQYWWYPSSFLLTRHPWFREADIIQLYNTHGGYFSHLALPRISRQRPVVWRLSDMWPLTGHCAYSHDCERWQAGCGSCPLLGDYPALKRDTTALLWKVKKSVYDRSKLVVVVTNSWMAGLVKESPLLGRFPVRTIPNGVDTEIFRPIPKAAARESLGIPLHAKVVLFSAHVAATGTRKGGEYVRPALERVAASGVRDLVLVVIGEGAEAWEGSPQYRTIRMGFTQSDRLLASIYAAADVLLHPAVVENLANGIIESLACGTPVAAFRVGGVTDVVRDGETGYLARLRDVEDLSEGLRKLFLTQKMQPDMAKQCRRTIEAGYTRETELRHFASLYEEMVRDRAIP
ncbi:MAG: glycosyltransferase family 4 protein [Candidatus Methylomirabilales bacterium]